MRIVRERLDLDETIWDEGRDGTKKMKKHWRRKRKDKVDEKSRKK
jgi:hypothetical protein